MEVLWGAVIGAIGALTGTIVGAALTQRLQRGTAAYTQLRGERLTAYSAFAAALMEYRRVQTERAFQRSQRHAAELGGELFPARSAAWAAYYRVRLLAGDKQIVDTAEVALQAAGAQPETTNEDEREKLAQACRVAVQDFLAASQRDIEPMRGAVSA
jgi:hypothetical protein